MTLLERFKDKYIYKDYLIHMKTKQRMAINLFLKQYPKN